jgi:DNA polymerase III sliding clamp (beta) subunit (PCNA family)
LRASSEDKVSFHFKDANSAGELRPAADGKGTAEGKAIADGKDGYKYRYVVMPMRI